MRAEKARLVMKARYVVARIALFALILSIGTAIALVVGETPGLALAEMSGAPVRVLAPSRDGDVLYTVLDGSRQLAGIYRSEDRGGTWRRVGSGPRALVNTLVSHPTRDDFLYAGTAGGPAATTNNLWLSYDGGQSWRRSLPSLPSNPDGYLASVTALAVDRSQTEILYVGTDGQGVYRLDANADSYGYELVGGVSLYSAHVKRLVVGPQGMVYALTSDGLFSSNGGAWQELPLPEMAASLAVSSQDPQILYAGGVSTGIYRSTDAGESWERISAGLDLPPGVALRVTALEVDEQDPYRVVAAASYGLGNRFTPSSVYESRDGGATWAKLVEADGLVTQLTPSEGAIYSVGEGGLARYGEQTEPLATVSSQRTPVGLSPLAKLSKPSGTQALILVLTVALAGLALAGRTKWIVRKTQIN